MWFCEAYSGCGCPECLSPEDRPLAAELILKQMEPADVVKVVTRVLRPHMDPEGS